MGPILALTATLAAPLRPHIVYLLADDFGWADADWHHPEGSTDPLATPHMSDLISQGIELGQHYSFKFCSPTRSSIQSGRNPIHVNVQNYQPVVWNWREPNKDPDAGFAGMARNMTGMGNVMKNAGYSTVMTGKWDVGMATPDHTPKARGYDSSLFYFHHDNDYWSSRVRVDDRVQKCPGQDAQLVDLWGDEAPASSLNNSYDLCEPKGGAAYPNAPNGSCVYEDELFVEHVLKAIQGHKEEAGPLFVFWAAHSVHAPLQVPKEFLDMYEDKVADNRRARYLAMVRWLDSALQRVTDALKAKSMWEDTLLVFTSDNGGPVYGNGGHDGQRGHSHHRLHDRDDRDKDVDGQATQI